MAWVAPIVMAASAAVSAASAAGAFDKDKKAPKVETPEPEDTGKVTEEEAKDVARKRLFRSGIFATSPTGLGGNDEPRATARLK